MIRVLAVILLLCPFMLAAEESFIPSDLALTLVEKHVPAAEWHDQIRNADRSFEQWQKDNPDGDRKRFLDDKLLQIAHAVPDKTETLKKYVMWLALYAHYSEPTPSYLERGGKYKQEIENLIEKDFSWDKALALVHKHADEVKEAQKR